MSCKTSGGAGVSIYIAEGPKRREKPLKDRISLSCPCGLSSSWDDAGRSAARAGGRKLRVLQDAPGVNTSSYHTMLDQAQGPV
ncbi:hypothetical protein NQZ68_010061 [Dissostichus eleginoides]|uniref:Fe-S cluster assembly protein dre2 n=1 Tax=Dissostichus eleginoides TaxID=100907 RepID=A0AAD9EZ80_DISEL|nr:hypothetical protein NQZ68_010061 [Dissostichus eleginoides]KAK1883504.1 Fe-S cluster assembly protein dre2 [Dissostichus eleginoides]